MSFPLLLHVYSPSFPSHKHITPFPVPLPLEGGFGLSHGAARDSDAFSLDGLDFDRKSSKEDWPPNVLNVLENRRAVGPLVSAFCGEYCTGCESSLGATESFKNDLIKVE